MLNMPTYSALADGQPLEWHCDGVLLALLWVFRFFALDIGLGLFPRFEEN